MTFQALYAFMAFYVFQALYEFLGFQGIQEKGKRALQT